MKQYYECISINKEFIDVFSEEADATQPNAWKTLIPNKIIKSILEKLLDALERGRPIDNKSLWIQGSYGTGKTFGSFFLKHILEDDLIEVEKYFQLYPELHEIWKRLETLRKGEKYIIIYRSSSSHITSQFKFLVEIQQAIKKALEEKGLTDLVDDTIYELILKKITNIDTTFNWEKAFEKYRNKFIEFKSPQEVLDHLKPENINLLQRVADVFEKENVVIFDNVQVIKEWIKKIIINNNLKGIIFIWDEFSDFFINDNNSIGSLQELAQLTAETPFYFILITHKKIEILFKNDRDNQIKISNRFHSFHFEMEPVTAYQLIKNSIIIENEDEWDDIKLNLWSKVDRKINDLMIDNVKKNDFRDILPIHPYSAYLLAMIADQLSSSQRTLAKFLKQDSENSFYKFIHEYPKNDWYWLTIDTLWDYFFTENNFELIEPPIREIYGYYCSRVADIEDSDEKRVFKAIILLFALSKKFPGNQLLKSSLKNLNLAFVGTPLIQKINKIKDNLKEVELIREIPSGKEIEFTIKTQNIDDRRLNEIKRSISPFRQEIKITGEIGRKIFPFYSPSNDTYEKKRIVLNFISANEFKETKNSIEPQIKSYQIGVTIIFPQDETELYEINKNIKNLKMKNQSSVYIISQLHFGKINWDKWIDQKASYQYYKEHQDFPNAQHHEIQIGNILNDWLIGLHSAKYKVIFRGEESEINGKQGYEKLLSEVISIIFPEGPEKILTTGSLYTKQAGVTAVKIGIGNYSGNITGQFRSLMDELKKFGDVENDDSFQNNPSHPLYQANIKIKQLFDENDSLNINDVWNEMQKTPFGYLDSPICLVLMGILMRQYSKRYYYFDGANTSPIIPDKMADIITEAIKLGKNQVVLTKITPESEEFCLLIREIFELDEAQTQEPYTTLQQIRNYLKNIGYPIWALKYSIQENNENVVLNKIICEIEGKIRNMDSSNLKEFNELLKSKRLEIKNILKSSFFNDGLKNFVKIKHPELLELIIKFDIDMPSLSSQIKLMMMEEVYLWTEEKVNSSLIQLFANFQMIDALNRISNIKEKNLDVCIINFNEWVRKSGKLPLFILADSQDVPIQQILNNLERYLGQIDKTKGDIILSQQLLEHCDNIKTAMKGQNIALKLWIKKYFNEDFSVEEIQIVMENLPHIHDCINDEQANIKIKGQIDELTSRKLMNDLSNKWYEITKAKSPFTWSNDHKIPIQWVFEGNEYDRLFNILNELQKQKRDDLNWALEFLERNSPNIKLTHQAKFINEKFLSFCCDEYKNLFHEEKDIDQLKNYLSENCQSDVYSWPNYFTQIKNISFEWIKEMYIKKSYPEVIKKIEKMSDNQLKESIVNLVKDPLIGSKFLKKGS